MSAYNEDVVDLCMDDTADPTPFFIQVQSVVLEHYERTQQPSRISQEESEAIAAAIAASERDEAERRKRRREELEEQERLAQQLQREEQSQADQELARALEVSAEEATTQQQQQELEESLSSHQQKRREERHAGVWDCVQCTFENPPYAPNCVLCQEKPPEGTLVFEDIPPDLSFGLELELVITDGKRDGYTLEWLGQEMTKLGPPHVQYHGYSHATADHWKIVTDSSLRGMNTQRDLCLELVSPVLKGNDGLTQLRVLMEHVRQLGIATNRTCGFHVHVDATSTPLSSLQRIAQCFVALENAFDLLVAKNKHRSADQNRYCRSNRIAFGKLSNRQRWDAIAQVNNPQELVELLNPGHDRYRKLNLTNIVNPQRPSTIEFRLHGGVQELREAEAWVRLLLRFCHRAPQTTSMIALSEEATPAMELQQVWNIVNCPGLEQFYVLDRKLFVPVLKNTWRCGKCRKPFETSRALAQHVEATGHR